MVNFRFRGERKFVFLLELFNLKLGSYYDFFWCNGVSY